MVLVLMTMRLQTMSIIMLSIVLTLWGAVGVEGASCPVLGALVEKRITAAELGDGGVKRYGDLWRYVVVRFPFKLQWVPVITWLPRRRGLQALIGSSLGGTSWAIRSDSYRHAPRISWDS